MKYWDYLKLEIVLVLGAPACGKSTTAESLAHALGGSFVSVGDLIRKAREDDVRVFDATSDAMLGQKTFDPTFLAELVHRAMLSAQSPLVIDAGPPIEEVFALLRVKPSHILWLSCPEPIRRARFLSRSRKESTRENSLDHLFSSRNDLFASRLPHSCEILKKICPITLIDSSCGRDEVVTQSLMALMAGVSQRKSDTEMGHRAVTSAIGYAQLVDAVTIAKRRNTPVTLTTQKKAGDLICVVKPNRADIVNLIGEIERSFANEGYTIGGVAIWPGSALAESGNALSHLGLHYIYSAIPTLLVPKLGESAGSGTVLGSFEFAREAGLTQLGTVWGGARPPTRIAPGAWIKNLPTAQTLVNGYVPPLVDDFHNPMLSTIAIILYSDNDSASSLRRLRSVVLGPSLKSTDSNESLRGRFYSGRIDTGVPPANHRNGFHLSASGLEAQREMLIWFGPDVFENFFANGMWRSDRDCTPVLIDMPPKNESSRSLYAEHENLMWYDSKQSLGLSTTLRVEAMMKASAS